MPLQSYPEHAEKMHVVINATSEPNIEVPIFSHQIVFDVAIRPLTPFLWSACLQGAHSISGIEMWSRQAAKQVALWHNLSEKSVYNFFRRCREEREKIQIIPSSVKGTFMLPASKSHTLRALFVGAFGDGVSTILNPLFSKDTDAALEACRAFGAHIEKKERAFIVHGVGSARHLKSIQSMQMHQVL